MYRLLSLKHRLAGAKISLASNLEARRREQNTKYVMKVVCREEDLLSLVTHLPQDFVPVPLHHF